MADLKSTLEIVTLEFKLERGPDHLAWGQEEKDVRQLLAECENFHLGLDHLAALLHHFQPKASLYSNFYMFMNENVT